MSDYLKINKEINDVLKKDAEEALFELNYRINKKV